MMSKIFVKQVELFTSYSVMLSVLQQQGEIACARRESQFF